MLGVYNMYLFFFLFQSGCNPSLFWRTYWLNCPSLAGIMMRKH